MSNSINKEVVVIGGGAAGVCAAIAAARRDTEVILIDRASFLGGTLTGAWVNPLMSFHNQSGRQVIFGIPQEIIGRLEKIGQAVGHVRDTIGVAYSVTPYDFEAMKRMMGEMLEEAGVEVLLKTNFTGALKENGFVREIEAINESGNFIIKGKVFIDASGDGNLAAFCGLPFQRGNEKGLSQPFTLIFKASLVNLSEVIEAMQNDPDNFHPTTLFDRLAVEKVIGVSGFFKEVKDANLSVPRDRVLFFSTLSPGEVLVNMTRISGFDPLKAEDIEKATKIAKSQALEIYEFLKDKIPGFENSQFSGFAPHIGIRESRRMVGEYVLTEDDVLEGRDFPDSIARGAFPIDIHIPDSSGWEGKPVNKDYGIPYRCLVNKKVKNLIFAGKCLSATFQAHGSARLSPTCMAMGEAAGIASAVSVKEKISADELNGIDIHKIIYR